MLDQSLLRIYSRLSLGSELNDLIIHKEMISLLSKSTTMYVYESVEIPHGMWSGKPKENMLAVINHHGQHSWRLNTMTTGVRNGRGVTIILFEKEVGADYYKTHEIEPLPPEYDHEDFV